MKIKYDELRYDGLTRDNFLNMMRGIPEIVVSESDVDDYDGIYVEAANPEALYVNGEWHNYRPYVRVSGWKEQEYDMGGDPIYYVREDGWCEYQTMDDILRHIIEMAKRSRRIKEGQRA